MINPISTLLLNANTITEVLVALTHIGVVLQIGTYPIATPHQQILKIQIPQYNSTVTIDKSEGFAIGTKIYDIAARERRAVIFESGNFFVRGDIPEFHGVAATRSQGLAIGTET